MSEKLQGLVLFLPTIGGQDAVDVLLDGIVFPHTFFQAFVLSVQPILFFGQSGIFLAQLGKVGEFVTDARRFQRPRRRFKENDFALTSSQILFLVTGFFVFAIDNGKMIKEISADDLENSFRKSIRIEVTDGKALAAVLKQTGQPYKMISSLMISVTFASIMTLLAILNTNKAGNVVVSMILALVLLVSGSFIHQKLGEPKLYDNYVTVNEMGIPTQVEQLPNTQYIEGTPRIVLEVLSDLLPSGQAIQLADAFDTEGMTDESIANAPYRWMGYSLLVTFLTSVLGIALFRKKEIR